MRARERLDPLLLLIIGAGALLRVLAAAGHSAHVSTDQRAYSLLALGLSEHGHYAASGLSGAFHWPPGAPFLFALANLAAPAHAAVARPEVPAAYVAQVVVGTATVPAAALVARSVAGRAAALIAAAVVALYPPLVASAGELLSEPLGALLLTLAVGALAWGLRRGTAAALAPCGALLGLAALTRADQLLAPAVMAAVVFACARASRGARRALAAAGVVVAAAAMTVAPWIAFVATQTHSLVPVSTGGGANLFIGTYLPGHGTIFGLKHAFGPVLRAHVPALRGVPDFRLPEETIVRYVAGDHRGRGEDAYLRARALRNAARFAGHRPGAFAGMLAAKAGRLWLDYTHGSLHRSQPLARVGHVALVALALLGLAAGLFRRRAPALVAVAALLALATVVNAVLVSEPRHLLPLLPLLFAGGAAGGVLAFDRRPAGVVTA